jgi:PIN domain nuclease of toxin-antitoxin system
LAESGDGSGTVPHAVYWWMTGSVRLSETARELIVDDTNTLLVSAVSIYELS